MRRARVTHTRFAVVETESSFRGLDGGGLWRREPFRVFFPLGVVLAWIGISHWLLYAAGLSATYSCQVHGLIQVQAFLMAFAVGFLLTALPRRTQGPPPSSTEMASAALALITIPVALDRGTQGRCAGGLRLCLRPAPAVRDPALRGRRSGQASARRVRSHSDRHSAWSGRSGADRRCPRPPCLAVGSTARTAARRARRIPMLHGWGGELDSAADERCAAARGSRLIPRRACEGARVRGHRAWPSSQASSSSRRDGAAARRSCGRPSLQLGLAVGGAARWPGKPGFHRQLAWVSIWMMPVGLAASGLLPDYRVPALHVLFIGGFGLLVFAVATHVSLSHLDLQDLASGRPTAVVILAISFGLALAARLAADFSHSYFDHLGWAAGCWLFGSAVWLVFIGRRLLRPSQ